MARHEHVFHQSWFNNFLLCPERARLYRTDKYDREENDSVARGSAVHAGIEATLLNGASLGESLETGLAYFQEAAETPGFVWEKVKTMKTALAHVQNALMSWHSWVLPTLGSTVWVEHPFEVVMWEDAKRTIKIAGTVDYAEQSFLADWKLTGNTDKYGKEGWKQQRWAIQPTFYVAGAYEEGLFNRGRTVPFKFFALSPQGREPQILTVERTYEHVLWLKRQLRYAAHLIESDVEVWPLNDQHALCSPKWCLAWRDCKGMYLDNERGTSVAISG